MATPPGNGLRTVNSLLMEISLHLVEQIVATTITANVTGGIQTVGVGSTVGMYVEAQVVLANADSTLPIIITITGLDPVGLTMTANFPAAYLAGSTLMGGTFPTQQPSDPLFTQSEVIDYVARAQNEFLAKVPLIFQFFSANVLAGNTFNTLPATAIELERVALVTGGTGYNEGGYNEGGYGGGAVLARLYEVSQQQLSMRDPNWYYNQSNGGVPTAWYEDRTGIYGWGVAGVPQANFNAELICSVRDSETLLLTDNFLLPDPFLHWVKYLALSYIWSKDGEARWATGARLMQKRFEQGVMIADRYLRSFIEPTNSGGGQ